MKKVLLVLVALVAVWASFASAQETGALAKKGSIHAGIGLSMPMSPDGFKENYGTGFGGGAGLGYMFTPMVEGVALFDYSSYSADISGVSGGDVTTTEFIGDVKFIFNTANTASKFKPYLLVGLGMASVKVAEITSGGTVISGEYSESALALRGGAGVEMWVSPNFAIYLDGKYTTVSTEGESTAYVPFHVGAKIPVF